MLPAPKSPLSQLWDRLAVIVRQNPVLKRTVKTFQLLEGKPSELADWETGMLPALRLAPGAEGAQWSAESQTDAPLAVVFEVGTSSTYAGDLFDLWQAVVTTFLPGDRSVIQALAPFGVYLVSLKQPAWSVRTLGDGAKALVARGTLLFSIHLNT